MRFDLRSILLPAALVVALLSSGCGGGISAGEVVAKPHREARTWMTLEQTKVGETCVGSGTNRVCTANYIQIPKVHHTPERWLLRLRDEQGHEGTVSVSRSAWQSTGIGDWYGEPREAPEP